MNFDRNTVIGFVLLALLFFGFFYFTNQEQARVLKNKAIQDSIAKAAHLSQRWIHQVRKVIPQI